MAARLVCLATLALGPAIAAAAPESVFDDPKDLLFHAMDKGRWLTFESIVVRRMSTSDRSVKQVRIAQNGGVSKTTVLSPLPEQGVTTVDDGKTWTTYIPDENRLMIQDSPKKTSWNRRRKSVADENYTFVLERGEPMAGRKVTTILATSKYREMPVRRYALDAEYPLLLRMEIQKDGKFVTMMDTKAISFSKVDERALRINPPAEARKMYLDAPQRFSSANDAVGLVGFKPSMPGPLPFGFEISEPQVVGRPGQKFVAIRISDGLASATVYQWSSSSENPVPCRDRKLVRDANGLRLKMVGDLPEVVLTKLLESFVKEALSGLQPLLGTLVDLSALKTLQDGEGRVGETLILIRVEA